MGTTTPLELWVWHHRERGGKPDQRVPLPVGARLVVGRDPDADVRVPSTSTSRRHLEVRRDGTGVWVTDLHSLGGTFVNWDRIRGPTAVNECDSVLAGGVELRLVPPARLDPAWLRWNDGTVPHIAQGIYETGRFEYMPVLHRALLDAGCDNQDILDHLRSPGVHVRGCWVLDLILGKE